MVETPEKSYPAGGVYREIVPVERLSFAWGTPDGWPLLDPENLDASPLITITLFERDESTEMVAHLELPSHLDESEVQAWFDLGIRDGWTQTLDRLVVSA
jgi:uncharacterized protein YndB with AHSA1/START domain